MFLKRLFIISLLLVLLLPSILFSLDITPEQFEELAGILQNYTELTQSLETTLTHQEQTLKTLQIQSTTQLMIIQQLDNSQRDLQKQTKDLESSYLRYKKTQAIKDYIMYGVIGVLVVAVIYEGVK